MNIQLLLYFYLFVSAGAILYHIVCIFSFRHMEVKLSRQTENFRQIILNEISVHRKTGIYSPSHFRKLAHKLRKSENFLAYFQALNTLKFEDEKTVHDYFEALLPTFYGLSGSYLSGNSVRSTLFLNAMKHLQLLPESPPLLLTDRILRCLQSTSVYCRENSFEAICSTGNVELVMRAIKLLDRGLQFHHSRLITEGLLSFRGNFNSLIDSIWEDLSEYSVTMQLALINFVRIHSGNYRDRFLTLMNDSSADRELIFSAIRYFEKYPDERAYSQLLHFADEQNYKQWEYAAIASAALRSYPKQETLLRLKENLHSLNWYIRKNSADSLCKLGVKKEDLSDILSGSDRFAREILQYSMDENGGIL